MFRNNVIPASVRIVLFGFMLSGLVSCSDEQSTDDNSAQIPDTKKVAIKNTLTAPSSTKGVVKKIQHAGGYSYIEIAIDGQDFWMASSLASVKVGEEIAWNSHAMMSNFNSKSLGRTFDKIIFVDKVFPVSAMQSAVHSGRVIKAMDSAGYSYIQVAGQGKSIWLAAPVTQVAVGQNISWKSGSPMQNFSSRSLNRTFDEIFFVSGVQLENT